jgi:hypothetical protein
MPATPNRRTDRRLYQPRLPLPGAPGPAPARRGRPSGAEGQKTATTQGRITTGRRPSTGIPISAPPAPDGGPSWRLDEKTRRAGRQGVAAARAALAGTAPPDDGRRADAA